MLNFIAALTFQQTGNEARTSAEKHAAYEKAVVHYTEAIELKPDFLDAYANLGIVYHDMGEFHKTLENYDAAIELNPNRADLLLLSWTCLSNEKGL